MHSSQLTAIIVAILTLLGCLFSHEPLTLLLVGSTLIVGLLLLWTENSIPMLLMPFLLQWLSVATKPVLGALTSTPVNDLSEFGGNLNAAAMFASLALMAFAAGLRIGKQRFHGNILVALQADVSNWSAHAMTIVSLALIVVGHFCTIIALYVPGLTELLFALGTLTYCGLLMLVYFSLRTGQLVLLAVAVSLAEVLFGLTGFFGLFRTTIFTIAVAAMCAQQRFKFSTILFSVVLAVPTLFLLVFWSSVKSDYRAMMNNGTENQSVDQPMSVRLQFLSDRARDFDGVQFEDGFEQLVSRVSYIDFLSMTLDYVPANTPHEGGARTFAAVTHIFTPRILFPDKPALESDTIVTGRYTGLAFTNYTYASISLGYLGEAYVDYGWPGAIVFVFVFGAIIGRMVSVVLGYRSLSMIMNAGLALMVTIPMWFFETPLIKTVGGTMAAFIAVMLLQRLILPNLLERYAGIDRNRGADLRPPVARGI